MIIIIIMIIIILVLLSPSATAASAALHDRNLYAAAKKCLQCLIKIMYTAF